jgi:hypothetical protein
VRRVRLGEIEIGARVKIQNTSDTLGRVLSSNFSLKVIYFGVDVRSAAVDHMRGVWRVSMWMHGLLATLTRVSPICVGREDNVMVSV